MNKLKKNSEFKSIKILVISSEKRPSEVQDALRLGAFDYLTKPINIHDVKNKVKAALHKNN